MPLHLQHPEARLQHATRTRKEDDQSEDKAGQKPERGPRSCLGGDALPAEQVALAGRWLASCPRFASAEHDAVGLAVLLMWSFPECHGVREPLTTERWEALLAALRADEGGAAEVAVQAELEAAHAPSERVRGLLARTRALLARSYS